MKWRFLKNLHTLSKQWDMIGMSMDTKESFSELFKRGDRLF